MDFRHVKEIYIPEGIVKEIWIGGVLVWKKSTYPPMIDDGQMIRIIAYEEMTPYQVTGQDVTLTTGEKRIWTSGT